MNEKTFLIASPPDHLDLRLYGRHKNTATSGDSRPARACAAPLDM
jgi:hypothetical protein